MIKYYLVLLLFFINLPIGKAIDQPKIDSLLNLIDNTSTDTLIFDYNYTLSLQYIKVNPSVGLKYISNGLNAINKNTYSDRYLDGLSLKAACFWFNNNMDSALLIYQESLELSNERNDSSMIAKVSNNIGVTYQYIGNIDSSEKYLSHACQLYKSIDNKKAYAKAALDLGGLYTSMSRYDLAIEKLLDGLSTFEEINDTLYLIHGYNGVGNLYLNIEEAELALSFYRKALRLTKIFEQADISDELYCNIGLAYFQGLNNNDSAEYYFLKALSKEGIENNHLLYSTTLVNLATLKNNQEKYSEALGYFNIVKSLKNTKSDPYSRMVCCINMGNTYLKIGQINKAELSLKEGLEQAIHLNSLEFQKNAYLYLSRVDSINGNYSDALDHYQDYYKTAIRINNTEIEEKIQIINSKHELKQVQTKNNLLEEQNQLKQDLIRKHVKLIYLTVFVLSLTLVILFVLFYIYRKTRNLNRELQDKNYKINKQKEELQTLNNQLNKLISIIAHDLKAPFSALIGLLNELNTNSEHYSEEEKNVIIKGLLQNTMSTYKLLENLMDWSVSKTGLLKMKPERVNLFNIVEEVTSLNQLQLRNKVLVLNNQLSPHTEVYGDHKMIYTILVNLISNAIKFSNQNGIIIISSETHNGRLKLHISDQGIGIPENQLQTIFSIDSEYQTRGTENEYGTGLGLKVVSEFISRMHGDVFVNSVESMGSTFTFELPINPPES